MGKRSSDSSLAIMSGASGVLLINDTTAHTGNFASFITVGTTVLDTVYQSTPSSASSSTPLTPVPVVKADLTNATLTDGKTVYPGVGDQNSYVFTSIKLKSGAVLATYQVVL